MDLREEFQADGREGETHGDSMKFNCPFHSEDTASCNVHHSHFKCFGCGEKGDALNYLSLVLFKTRTPNSTQFIEVLREGCARTGLEFQECKQQENQKAIGQKCIGTQIPEPKKIYSYEKLRQFCDYLAAENKEIIPKDCGWNESRNPQTDAVEFIEIRFESTVKTRKANDGRKAKPAKRFFQCSAVEGGFILALDKSKKTPLFNRKQILESEVVIVVEGFKCMKFLWAIGLCATCAAGGSNNPVSNVDWTPLHGKTIVIWPDNDETGLAWAMEVKIALETIECQVSFVRVEELGLQEKDDVIDYFDYVLRDEKEERNCKILELVSESRKETISRQIQDEISGKRYALEHPSFYALASTNCFLPSTVTVLCASEGVSKSMVLAQWTWQMYFDNVADSAYVALESGDVLHGRRMMAQMAGNSQFLNWRWVKNNPEKANQIVTTFQPMLDELIKKKVLYAPSLDTAITPEYIYALILEMKKLGKNFIVIDPVTKLEIGENIAREQRVFVRKICALALRTGLRILLVTHPIKNCQGVSAGNMAGSAAFKENPDSIFWLTEHETLFHHTPNANNPMISDRKPYNRTMKILKCRLGYAPKREIGYFIDPARLIHEEVGFVENTAI